MPRLSRPKKPKEYEEVVRQIKTAVGKVETLVLSKPATKRLREALLGISSDLEHAVASLDPVKEPRIWFDPADPVTAGRLVAAALIAQPRVPMELVQPSYGAGIYAIYYTGGHPAYSAISGKETPIYVGKADPEHGGATTPRQQGPQLSGRLAEHRRTIRAVEDYARKNELPPLLQPIAVADFECRRLVTATNAQMYAERHLIDLFKPVWNSEIKICWGMSMHGDVTARTNSRPPWHVLHPGAKWALRDIEDASPAAEIIASLSTHFANVSVYDSPEHIIELFLKEFIQDPLAATHVIEDEPLLSVADLGLVADNRDESEEGSSDEPGPT